MTVEIASEQYMSKYIATVKKLHNNCNAILYTNQILHDIFNHYILHKIPNTTIQVDHQELLRALLKASIDLNTDVRTLSIDTISYNDIRHTYDLLDIKDSSRLSITTVSIDYLKSDFIQNIASTHIHNHLHNNALIITDITEVAYRLKQKDYSVILLNRSVDSILRAVKNLITKSNIAIQRQNKIAVITISLSMPSENFILESTQHSLILAYNRIAESVFWFAEKVSGCFIAISRKQYCIFCDSKILEAHTEDYTKLQLLDAITEKQLLSVFVGIGYGKNHRDAMKLSTIAHSRATTQIESRAYVMYNSKEIVGPILPSNQKNNMDSALFDIKLSKISKDASISIDTIYKIQAMIAHTKRQEYTTESISEHLNISTRTVNRLLEKLENAGYLEVIGRKSRGGKGRPSRVFRFIF